MKDRIEQIARGEIVTEQPELIFFPESLVRDVPVRTVIRLEILIKSRNKVPFKCFFCSTEDHVLITTPALAGQSGTVVLEIHTERAEIGDILNGSLVIISNAGEQTVPFTFTVTDPDGRSAAPQTLEAFVSMAREHREHAYQIFSSATFTHLPFMQQESIAALYEGICRTGKNRQAMEEFLCGCQAKEPVRFTVESSTLSYTITSDEQRGEIPLSISSWGYLRIRPESSEPWLTFDSNSYTAEDAKDGVIHIGFTMHRDEMHGGANGTRVTLRSYTQEMQVDVVCSNPIPHNEEDLLRRRMQASLSGLLLDYLNMSYEEPVISARLDEAIFAYIARYPNEMALYLLRAWVFLQNGQDPEARAILDRVRRTITKKRGENPADYCALLYLDNQLLSDPASDTDTAKRIQKYFETFPSFLIALLELFMQRSVTDEQALSYLQDLYSTYGPSPFVYAYAARIYRANPRLLSKPTLFGMQVVNYMVRHDCCPDEVVEVFLSWTVDPAGASPALKLLILQRLYSVHRSDRLLSAICTLFMRQEASDPAAFVWYEKGVQQDLRLPNLYNYYLLSHPMSDTTTIDPSVLVYFSYGSGPDERCRLRLYAYILRHYGRDTEMYQDYAQQMTDFALERLLAGKMNPDLVQLYDTVLSPELVDARLASVLPNLLYARLVKTNLPGITNIVVHYPQLRHETIRPVENGQAIVPVYADNVILFFEDRLQNRCLDLQAQSVRLMDRPELLAACRRFANNERMLLLEDTKPLYESEINSDEMFETARKLYSMDNIEESFRRLLLSRIVDYIYRGSFSTQGFSGSRIKDVEITDFLAAVPLESMTRKDRCRTVEILILRDRMKEAYQAILTCGFTDINVSLLLKLAVRSITEQIYEYDEGLLRLGAYLLEKEQWNEILLTYMARHYNGPTKEVFALLMNCQKMQAESFDLAERVVAQMMFTGLTEHLDEAYACYIRTPSAASFITRAYQVIKCDRFLIRNEVLSDDVEKEAELAIMQEGLNHVPFGFVLAVLKHFSNIDSLSQVQKKLCESIVYDLGSQGKYTPYTQELTKHIEMPHQMEGRLIVSWIGSVGKRVSISGKRNPDERDVSGPLTEIYPGIYSAAVFLFPDETAEVTVLCENGTAAEEVDIFALTGKDAYVRKGSVYDRISTELSIRDEKREEELERLISINERKKKTAAELFMLQ